MKHLIPINCITLVRISFFFLLFCHWKGYQKAQAGPWTKSFGQVYAKVSENLFLSSGSRDANGQFQEGTNYLAASSALYAEFGIFKGLQIQTFLPYVISQNALSNGASYTHGAFGDLRIGAQWGIPKLSFPLAIRVDLKIPGYDLGQNERTEKARLKEDFPDRNENELNAEAAIRGMNFPAVGDGQIDIDFWLTGGWAGGPFYAFAEFGYRFRTEAFIGSGFDQNRNFLDTFLFNTQFGWTFWRPFLFMASFNGVLALGDDVYSQSFLNASISLYLPFTKNLNLELSYSPIFWARNAAETYMVFNVGLSFSM